MYPNIRNLEIDFAVQDPVWEEIEHLEDFTKRAIRYSFETSILPREIENKDVEISIVFANDALIQVLNREYRNKDKPTNVLTFAALDAEEPQDTDTIALGDVILSYETIHKEALEQDKFFRDHLIHMIVHGTLHILGYDHESDDEATTMEALEIRILEHLDIQNPYTEKAFMA